jgi:hypothetical protein
MFDYRKRAWAAEEAVVKLREKLEIVRKNEKKVGIRCGEYIANLSCTQNELSDKSSEVVALTALVAKIYQSVSDYQDNVDEWNLGRPDDKLKYGPSAINPIDFGESVDAARDEVNVRAANERANRADELRSKAQSSYQRIFDEKAERCEYIAKLEKCVDRGVTEIKRLEKLAYPKMKVNQEINLECHKHEWGLLFGEYEEGKGQTLCIKCHAKKPEAQNDL